MGESQAMKKIMISLVRDEQGQDLIEYALLAGLIAVICIASVTLAGSKVSSLFSNVAASLP
jgi:pilus assembly protein Flp/PilA